ncbi:MAG: glycosyl transferase [Muribaculum sp.]|nr:glycosyl transferase [Muribaculum sp.]
MRRIIKYIARRLLIFLPDKIYLKIIAPLAGLKLDFDNPQTLEEKLQWMKIYDRNPLYTTLVDKVKVKDWVAERIGDKYIIPTLAVYDKAEDVDFAALPNKFVIKCNHNSGLGMYICKDKATMDEDKVRRNLKKGLRENYYLLSKEWPYKNVPRKILVEQFMENEGEDDLADYKWFCFNGKPMYSQVIRNRNSNETIDFYDVDWNHMEFVGLTRGVKNGLTEVARPIKLDEMIQIATKLSQGLPFARVDLYNVNGDVYFGEITFFPNSGYGHFSPEIWDYHLGALINLPAKR